MSVPITELDAVGRASLASILSDVPETALTVARLRAGQCRVLSLGDTVLVSCETLAPGAPTTFGSSPSAILDLLGEVPGWRSVDVAPKVADPLAAMLAERGVPVTPVPDVYLVATESLEIAPTAQARFLGRSDAAMLDAARDAFAAIDPSLAEPWPVSAGVEVDGALVSLCAVNARTTRHANLTVATLPAWRDRGFATAAAALVTSAVVRTKRRAVWNCAETNLPALAIARSLSYEEASRRALLVRD